MGSHFEQSWIDDVKAGNDLADVVSEYVRLKPSGKGFFGLCPFHKEKTPSFHIHSDKQIYRCFGCGEGGNVITFVMSIERLNFVEAVLFLARRAGIVIPEEKRAGVGSNEHSSDMDKEFQEKIYKANVETAKFYRATLLAPEGRKAYDYLESRGIGVKTVNTFGLGFAPAGWDSLKNVLLKAGFDERFLIKAGLLAENSGNVYDRFRNRVIFPIIDLSGRVVGFGGRSMDDSLPKYLNSSETLAFNKGKVLYGLNRLLKKRPLDTLILVEGYMDVLTMHQFGFDNAVASLGTSLTREQAKILNRFSKQVLIAYDGDSAGQKAALRALEVLRDTGCSAKVLVLPDGADPDDVLRKSGAEAFNSLIKGSLTIDGFKLRQLAGEYDMNAASGKTDYAKSAADILTGIEDLIERNEYIKIVSDLSGLSTALIRQEVERRSAKDTFSGGMSVKRDLHGNNRHSTMRNGYAATKRDGIVAGHVKAERDLAGLMVQNDNLALLINDKLGESVFEEDVNRKIASIVVKALADGRKVNPANVLDYVEDKETAKRMVEIFDVEMEYDSIEKFISDCVDTLSRRREEKLRRERQEELMRMDKEGKLDPALYNILLLSIDASNRRIKLKGQGDEGNI